MSHLKWQRSIEQIVLTSAGDGQRVVGLAALHPNSGVSRVAHDVARMLSSAGRNTLRLDASARIHTRSEPSAWTPKAGSMLPFIAKTADGYDVLRISVQGSDPGSGTLLAFEDRLSNEFAGYEKIVVDLANLIDPPAEAVNPLAVARVCDSLVLVCAVGRDRQQDLLSATGSLAGVGAKFTGFIANEHFMLTASRQLKTAPADKP